MNNFLSNLISKIIPSKNEEKKEKEEEDNFNNVFNFNISLENSKIYEHLDYYVQGITFNNTTISSFEKYLSVVSDLIDQYKEEVGELQYRYKQECEKNKVESKKGNLMLLVNLNFKL